MSRLWWVELPGVHGSDLRLATEKAGWLEGRQGGRKDEIFLSPTAGSIGNL